MRFLGDILVSLINIEVEKFTYYESKNYLLIYKQVTQTKLLLFLSFIYFTLKHKKLNAYFKIHSVKHSLQLIYS